MSRFFAASDSESESSSSGDEIARPAQTAKYVNNFCITKLSFKYSQAVSSFGKLNMLTHQCPASNYYVCVLIGNFLVNMMRICECISACVIDSGSGTGCTVQTKE